MLIIEPSNQEDDEDDDSGRRKLSLFLLLLGGGGRGVLFSLLGEWRCTRVPTSDGRAMTLDVRYGFGIGAVEQLCGRAHYLLIELTV
jgi:hypothetical protein